MNDFVLLKFGGTSVATLSGWQTIAGRVTYCLENKQHPVVVCSALAGVTNQLQLLASGLFSEGESATALQQIIQQHKALLDEAGVGNAGDRLQQQFDRLTELVSQTSAGKPLPVELHAQLLAQGELLSTLLGHQVLQQVLQQQGVDIVWRDTREAIHIPEHPPPEANTAHYLNSHYLPEANPGLQQLWQSSQASIVPGFIARDAANNTVVLGRGGSDTTASYLAVLLNALRVEIWTDVPGLFSANPHQVPSARLLRHLSYLEAQEIASAGGRVLHPRCLRPLKDAHIPLHVYSTRQPDVDGSQISDEARDFGAQVKAIVCSYGITLISMETLGMWQQVGFLAEAFAVFQQHGLSVDLIATSESNVTVTLDPAAQLASNETLADLEQALSKFCRVSIQLDCAAVTMVGRGIRTILHRLGPALEAFEERRIYLLSQAANDLNLSVVVPREHADTLVRQLHETLIPKQPRIPDESVFGPSWEVLQIHGNDLPEAMPSWYRRERQQLLQLAQQQDAAYVYHLPTIESQALRLLKLESIDRVLYAMKANNHPAVLNTLHNMGVGFDCVSMAEVEHLQSEIADFTPEEILFTPNFAPVAEYQQAFMKGLTVTLDNLFPLQHWPELLRNRSVFLRVDPGQGHGHHQKVKTAGSHSKFGIPMQELEQARALCRELNVTVNGLHVHIGSGLTVPDNWRRSAELLTGMLSDFPDVHVIDLGGGLSVPTKPGDGELELEELDRLLLSVKQSAKKLTGQSVQFWLEPGRFLVSEAGVLLVRVTQTKGKGDVRYVGVSSGMNSLIRPALYGAYHDIQNLTRLDDPVQRMVNVVGPICETADILGLDRMLPDCQEGDVLLVANAGAYGRVMSSHYNLREPAIEVILS